MARDARGRFIKGETPDCGQRINEGNAREFHQRAMSARAANKRGKELLRLLLDMDVRDEMVVDALRKAGYPEPEKMSNEMAMHLRQIEKAQKMGDTRAYSAIMETAGYKRGEDEHGDVIINVGLDSDKASRGLVKALASGAKPRKPKDEQ